MKTKFKLMLIALAALTVLSGHVRGRNSASMEDVTNPHYKGASSFNFVGDLNPEATYEINHLASVRLAEAAREAGVPRFFRL